MGRACATNIPGEDMGIDSIVAVVLSRINVCRMSKDKYWRSHNCWDAV